MRQTDAASFASSARAATTARDAKAAKSAEAAKAANKWIFIFIFHSFLRFFVRVPAMRSHFVEPKLFWGQCYKKLYFHDFIPDPFPLIFVVTLIS